jgi:hypothetical protein
MRLVGEFPEEKKEKSEIRHAVSYSPNDKNPLQFTDRRRLFEWQMKNDARYALSAFSKWADSDFGAASEWLASRPEDTIDLDQMRKSLAEGLARNDTKSAIDWAMRVKDPRLRESTLREVCAYWSEIEPWGAVAWAQENLGWSMEECCQRLRLK